MTIGHVLPSLLPLATFLQAKHCNLVETTTVIAQPYRERANPEVCDALFDSAVELAEQIEIEASKLRNAGRQRHRKNVSADDVSAVHRPFAAGNGHPISMWPSTPHHNIW